MTQTLELTFTDDLKKPLKLQLSKIENDVDATNVRTSMAALIDLDILRIAKSNPTKVHSAHLIDKTVRTLFDVSKSSN
ncbi:DUF2922 domain-containing protein [Staphylococcus durrellii]|uniref:DUF2922 domain-containing protein n=1 Tax=Staphylococcus durrellii TaxID=2781773 RepID=UPI00189E2CA6|nr:DUF2922 domain-containing protein [Staphylococcus durrellii]MBF7017755.1 DUF2922 domain-containing protein [Staphylococcus durrellii]